MENENQVTVEAQQQTENHQTAPVKKVVVKKKIAQNAAKRKPVIKAEVPQKEDEPMKEESPKAAPEPVISEKAEEKSEEKFELKADSPAEATPAPKKRGRRPKAKVQPAAEENAEKTSSEATEKPSEEPKEVNAEEKASTQPESENKNQTQEQEQSQEQVQEQKRNPSNGQKDHRNNNQNGQMQKGRNRFQNNGQKNQMQKKAPLTMDEVTVSESEYNSHLENRLIVSDLSQKQIGQLKEILSQMAQTSVEDYAEYKKQEVIVEILKTHSQNGGVIYANGTLEILSEGYGFLRSPLNSYLSGPEDVYVSPAIIKFLNLKTGDTIEGIIRNPKDNERFFALARIAFINGDAPIVAKTRTGFDSLVPLYPDERINLETERKDNDVSMRIINLFCPIGKGQRALITAPPRTGKTILLQQMANAITENHPEVKLIVLLVDERPEEVTDMRRNVKGEVIASTFDEQATRHVTVAEMVIEKAKRLVEHKHDVVILLDSITRLARAYNQTVPASGKILSGGVDSNALHRPKRFFGAARNIENGGSLTIIASALIETGSRMDEVIFEEFKGTGNSEIVLDRRMADRRLFPAINIKKSGTRREDLLLESDEAARIWILRNAINGLEDLEMTEFLVDKMRKTKNNEAFLRSMNTGAVPGF